MDNTDDSLSNAAPRGGPGGRLRAARLRRGQEIGWAAGQLHVKSWIIEAIEADDLDRLPSPVFVKGYLRNYAQLLGESVEDVLLEYRRAGGERQSSPVVKQVAFESGDHVSSGDFSIKLISMGVVLMTLGLFLVWGISQIDWSRVRLPDGMTQRIEHWVASIPLLGEGPNETAPGGLAAPQTDEAEPKMDETAPSPVTEQKVTTEAVDAAPAGNVLSQLPEAVLRQTPEPHQGVPERPLTGNAPAAAQPAPAPGGAESTPAAGKPVVLVMSGSSWIDIRDASGGYRLFGDRKSGERHVLGGTPPYKMVIGNISSVSMTVDGKPYDFSTFKKGSVARFTLAP